MATITINGFIHVQSNFVGGPRFEFMPIADMSQYGWTCIKPHAITVEVPDDAKYLPEHIASLERRRAAALDEAAAAERELAQLAKIAAKDA